MNKAKKKFRLKRMIVLPWEMSESIAFQKLTAIELRVLMRFHQKRKFDRKRRQGTSEYYTIYHDDPLDFPYSEAEYLGISKASFYRSIKELVKLGFIDIEHQGGFYGRDYSRFKISERWKQYGTDDFKERKKKRVLPPGWDVQARKMRAKRKQEKSKPQLVTRIKTGSQP